MKRWLRNFLVLTIFTCLFPAPGLVWGGQGEQKLNTARLNAKIVSAGISFNHAGSATFNFKGVPKPSPNGTAQLRVTATSDIHQNSAFVRVEGEGGSVLKEKISYRENRTETTVVPISLAELARTGADGVVEIKFKLVPGGQDRTARVRLDAVALTYPTEQTSCDKNLASQGGCDPTNENTCCVNDECVCCAAAGTSNPENCCCGNFCTCCPVGQGCISPDGIPQCVGTPEPPPKPPKDY